MHMNKIDTAVQQAIAPLQQDIKTLKTQLAALAPLVAMAKVMEPPAPVKEAHAILSAIPEETQKALRIVSVGFDPKIVWFQLVRENGTRVSVKKQENDFRVRVRRPRRGAVEGSEPVVQRTQRGARPIGEGVRFGGEPTNEPFVVAPRAAFSSMNITVLRGRERRRTRLRRDKNGNFVYRSPFTGERVVINRPTFRLNLGAVSDSGLNLASAASHPLAFRKR